MCSRPPKPQQPSLVHSALLPIASLLGTWKGKGSGKYPTIEPFQYEEELVFSHVGKPFIEVHQRTWHPVSHLPMHTETGYIRMTPAGPELVVADPTGYAEVFKGELSNTNNVLSLNFTSTVISKTPTAKDVTGLTRNFRLGTDSNGAPQLSYELGMAAVGQPMQVHLTAELSCVPLMTPADLQRFMPNVIVIDCREPSEIETVAAVPDAKCIPLATLTANAPDITASWDKFVPIVVCCNSGGRSMRLVAPLRALGFVVYSLDGGVKAWHQSLIPPSCSRKTAPKEQ